MESKQNIQKCPQKSYTVTEKLEVVKCVKELNGNLSAASRELSIDRKCLQQWSQNESTLTNMPDKKWCRIVGGDRGPKHQDLEAELLEWVIQQ